MSPLEKNQTTRQVAWGVVAQHNKLVRMDVSFSVKRGIGRWAGVQSLYIRVNSFHHLKQHLTKL